MARGVGSRKPAARRAAWGKWILGIGDFIASGEGGGGLGDYVHEGREGGGDWN